MDYSKSGFIYVVQMEGHGYYKIGRTVNPGRRMTQIAPQMPGRLAVYMVHRVLDAPKAEGRLHQRFADQRLNGEWFHLDQDCLNEIRADLLLEQAITLHRRLAETIFQSQYEIYFNPARFAHALYKAALRVERRHNNYGVLYFNRTELPSDDVTTAEAVV